MASSSSSPRIGSFVDNGRFQLVDTLGKGGSGTAFLAVDTQSPSKAAPNYYAIKAIPRPAHGGESHSLQREIRLHKLVGSHDAIVGLHRSVIEGAWQFLVMDYCPGGDLFRQITVQNRYFLNDALITDVFLQIIDAVEYSHAMGVFHRDLKPENILCNEDGTSVFLADFGLATREAASDDLGVGSGYYMSPECNLGPSYSTDKNDVWSLGVILSNLAYGRNPWASAHPSDATFAAYARDPTRSYLASILPVPSDVNAIFRGVFALDPRQRWSLPQLRSAVKRVRTWACVDERELVHRGVPAEARSVAAGLRAAVKDRDARGIHSPFPRARELCSTPPPAYPSSAAPDYFSAQPHHLPASTALSQQPRKATGPAQGLRLVFSKRGQHQPQQAAVAAAQHRAAYAQKEPAPSSPASTASDDSLESAFPLTPPVHNAARTPAGPTGKRSVEFPFPSIYGGDRLEPFNYVSSRR